MEVNEYLELTANEKIQFIQTVLEGMQTTRRNTNVSYTLKQRKRKTAGMRYCGDHQPNGRLMYVDELSRTDIQSAKVYYLCKCDCGNWHICRSDAFGKGSTDGGCYSCGCLNKESYTVLFADKEIQNKRIENLKTYLADIGVNVGDNINGWQITQTEIQERAGKYRRYIKGICPYCKKESDWIRPDGIQSGAVHSCGCASESIGEQTIRELLCNAKIAFEQEKTFESCRSPETGRLFRFDFYIPKDNYIIEFDGKQHFDNDGGFFSNEAVAKTQARDILKNKWCMENNIPLIRIPYYHLKKLTINDIMLSTTEFLYKGELNDN